ncbi:MAG: hypothetical protein M9949_09685 [Candidatus Kapabacteria bacterium]|nr:hypothetical protein [Candidatus Kapabacteria bacterium]
MSNLISEYTVKLTSFKYLSWVMTGISVIYILSGVTSGDQEKITEALTGGIIGLLIALFFYYFGKKSRTISMYDDKLQYTQSNKTFTTTWDNLALVKSYQEDGKQSENLIIMTEDERLINISSAYFEKSKLISAYKDIYNFVNENFEDNSVTFEDDRDWLKSE